MKVFFCILVALCFVSVQAQSGRSCPTCNRRRCPKLECEGSTISDACGCCRECAKVEGETCEGLGGFAGTCDKGLACIHDEPKITPAGPQIFHHRGQTPGNCRRSYRNCMNACADTSVPTAPSHFSVQAKSVVLAPSFEEDGFWAYCDCSAGADQAWMVIQRRASGLWNFNLFWGNYEQGFGISGDDFWLGLTRMHKFTKDEKHEAMIIVQYEDTYTTYSTYKLFQVGNPGSSYRLTVRENSGENSLDFMNTHNGMRFSTVDEGRDNDKWSGECAEWLKGGWWYNSCTKQNLNGVHYAGQLFSGIPAADGPDRITWNGCRSQRVKAVEMRIRPVRN